MRTELYEFCDSYKESSTSKFPFSAFVECNRPDCYHCNHHHPGMPDEDVMNTMNELNYEQDSDLDKLDDAAGLEQNAQSKFPRFSFSYCKVLGVTLLLVLVQHTFKVM